MRPNVQIVSRDGDNFVLNLRNGEYWHLNSSAYTMLTRIADGETVDEVARDISAATSAPEQTVRDDLTELVDQLRKAKLVEVRHS
ncbi:hypothetical protein LP52_05070 [Streptomonospora alba]|uniref:Lasso peptide biosynthesis PqqD family chaperone n=2 Tax=Streptomonospora alba TaxID=183763 RepID=A0A0C2JL46_9ACTN|nr:hypothetical protein LP52_05070 [Streptomonospora alba]